MAVAGVADRCRLGPQLSASPQHPDGKGYFVASANGSVYAFGDADVQRLSGRAVYRRGVVGIAVDPRDRGLLAGDFQRRGLPGRCRH